MAALSVGVSHFSDEPPTEMTRSAVAKVVISPAVGSKSCISWPGLPSFTRVITPSGRLSVICRTMSKAVCEVTTTVTLPSVELARSPCGVQAKKTPGKVTKTSRMAMSFFMISPYRTIS